MGNLHLADAVVLVTYLVGITGLGVWMGRRVRDMGDFFMPRRFGKTMMVMHAFGTGTATDSAVTVASATARNGLSGIWYQWMWLLATPFYWLIAPIMRRFRAVTTADVYQLRYDRSVAMLFAAVGIAGMLDQDRRDAQGGRRADRHRHRRADRRLLGDSADYRAVCHIRDGRRAGWGRS